MRFAVLFPLVDISRSKAAVKEEVEGAWLGHAVTLLPPPMTVLHFPPALSKRGCGADFVSLLPLSPDSSSDSLCGLVTYTMLLFHTQLA